MLSTRDLPGGRLTIVLSSLCAAQVLLALPTGLLAARLRTDVRLAVAAGLIGLYGVGTLTAAAVTTQSWPYAAVMAALAPAAHAAVAVLVLTALVPLVWCRRVPSRAFASGVVVLGLTHVVSAAVASHAVANPWLVVAGLRLAAGALVLGGTVVLAVEALELHDRTRDAQDEELRLAEVDRARAAERDHELRNGLAGLAGAARLLADERSDGDLLDAVVHSELRRLDDLLRGSAPSTADEQLPSGPDYEVEPVLRGLQVLRRASETEVHVEVTPGLRARGSSSTLAQVVTNLVANVERHAPGSPVWITATTRGERVIVTVRDVGPGIVAGREDVVFASGVHDATAGGRGLGLHLCRRLLAREDASIAIARADRASPGCTVVVELPSARLGGDELDATEAPSAPGRPAVGVA